MGYALLWILLGQTTIPIWIQHY